MIATHDNSIIYVGNTMLPFNDISLYVYITFYTDDKTSIDKKNTRLKYLAELLLHLSYISVKNLHVKIFTNNSEEYVSNSTKPVKARNTANCTAEIFKISNMLISNFTSRIRSRRSNSRKLSETRQKTQLNGHPFGYP